MARSKLNLPDLARMRAGTEAGAPCEILPWDSEHFGLSIARIVDGGLDEQQAADADRWCAQNGVDCLYLLVAADDAETERVASRHGFRPVDVRLGLRHDLDGLGELPWHSPGPLTVRRANEADLEVLRPLARTSHRSTRFYFDGGFPVDRCDELYARWIERALAEPERELLVAEVDGAPVGYQAVRLPGANPARADLIALDPDTAGAASAGRCCSRPCACCATTERPA